MKDKCGRFESSRDELQLKLSNLIAQSEELEGQLEDEADKCRHMEVLCPLVGICAHTDCTYCTYLPIQGECNRLVCSKRELETMVTEMKACNEDLRIQLDDKERKCHDTEVILSCTACMCNWQYLGNCSSMNGTLLFCHLLRWQG